MSHLRAVETQYKDSESLVKALKELGMKPVLAGKAARDVLKKEVPKARILDYYDYKGCGNSPAVYGDIVLKKADTDSVDDVGFVWNEEEERYVAHFSDRDYAMRVGNGIATQSEFTQQLKSRYNYHNAHKIAESIGATVNVITHPNGRRRYELRQSSQQIATTRR